MPHTIITQLEEVYQQLHDPEESLFDTDGLPQLPLSDLAKRLRDLTNPSPPRPPVRVKSYFRHFPGKKKKKTSQNPLDKWLLKKKPTTNSKQAPPTKKLPAKPKSTPPSTNSLEKDDRKLAFSMHIKERLDLLRAQT
jgi:hypothetical protein